MSTTHASALLDQSSSRQPAKDKSAFLSLLPGSTVEFVEGSSSGTLVVGHSKLEPINLPIPSKSLKRESLHNNIPKRLGKDVESPPSKLSKQAELFTGIPNTNWVFESEIGKGLNNTGNTCFLNSALQCLIHTAPLHHVLKNHEKSDCRVKNGFCMSCALRSIILQSLLGRSRTTLTPSDVTNGLRAIAKHMVRGRQEDSHEFLRFAVEALQKSCLAGQPPKLDPKIAETTWVHKIFGGRLRSRVTCGQCHQPSDTFDSILDLSLEINGVRTLREALQKFTKVEHLNGANKYKCEKCKRLVPAEKQFTVHEAPLVLTVHLKRFSPLGRKIGHPISYDERLSLSNVMSDRQQNLSYSLYGVICHAGGGPNSGHYYAHVKGGKSWYEMNDESVTRCSPPTSLKSAYILFYMRDKGQNLQNVINSAITARSPVLQPLAGPSRPPLTAGMKKRKRHESEDVDSPESKRPFIGPVQPSLSASNTPSRDPQAAALQRKIASAAATPPILKPSNALSSLAQYSDGDEDVGEKVESALPDQSHKPAPPLVPVPISTPTTPPPKPTAQAKPAIVPVPASSFYGAPSTSTSSLKRKADDQEMLSMGLPSSFTAKSTRRPQQTYSKRRNKFAKQRKELTAGGS